MSRPTRALPAIDAVSQRSSGTHRRVRTTLQRLTTLRLAIDRESRFGARSDLRVVRMQRLVLLLKQRLNDFFTPASRRRAANFAANGVQRLQQRLVLQDAQLRAG